jgi:hypothetical protein
MSHEDHSHEENVFIAPSIERTLTRGEEEEERVCLFVFVCFYSFFFFFFFFFFLKDLSFAPTALMVTLTSLKITCQ